MNLVGEDCAFSIQEFRALADQRGLRPSVNVGSGKGGNPTKLSSFRTYALIRVFGSCRRNLSSEEREMQSFLQTLSISRRTSSELKSKTAIHFPKFDANRSNLTHPDVYVNCYH